MEPLDRKIPIFFLLEIQVMKLWGFHDAIAFLVKKGDL